MISDSPSLDTNEAQTGSNIPAVSKEPIKNRMKWLKIVGVCTDVTDNYQSQIRKEIASSSTPVCPPGFEEGMSSFLDSQKRTYSQFEPWTVALQRFQDSQKKKFKAQVDDQTECNQSINQILEEAMAKSGPKVVDSQKDLEMQQYKRREGKELFAFGVVEEKAGRKNLVIKMKKSKKKKSQVDKFASLEKDIHDSSCFEDGLVQADLAKQQGCPSK